MSIFLTCFLNMLIDSEFFILLLNLDHITAPVYRILCQPYVLLLIPEYSKIIRVSKIVPTFFRMKYDPSCN